MSNNITIELCAEDRARLDRLAEALERRTCDKCVTAAVECIKTTLEPKKELDPVQQAFAATLAKAESPVEPPKNATEEAEDSTQATTPLEEEKPTEEEPTKAEPTEEAPAQAEPTKTVTHADLLAKVIELSAKDIKLKARARDIVLSYAPRVKEIPEAKLNECYGKIVALEG